MSVTLCLGEALVDLIGEAPAPSVGAVDRFEPHFGGATANVAVFAARAGARISLAGAAGEDRWGRWLRERLVAERVDAAHFPLVQGLGMQLAFVCVDDHGKPTYELYGELDEPLAGALAARIETAVDGAALTGTLLARLALSDFYPAAAAAALDEAVAVAAAACERWGALD